jgi:hypothetical protein
MPKKERFRHAQSGRASSSVLLSNYQFCLGQQPKPQIVCCVFWSFYFSSRCRLNHRNRAVARGKFAGFIPAPSFERRQRAAGGMACRCERAKAAGMSDADARACDIRQEKTVNGCAPVCFERDPAQSAN